MLDFPNTPTVGSVFTSGLYRWTWDGQKWNSSNSSAPSGQFLPLTGGTLTGPLYLNADATAGMQAVTFNQLIGGFLPLSGGVMTGLIQLSGDAVYNFNPVTLQQMNAALSGINIGVIDGNLQVNGTILSTSVGGSGQLRMTYQNGSAGYGSFWRNDGVTTYLLMTNFNDALGTWNGLRPIAVDDATGVVNLGNGLRISGGSDLQSTSFANKTPRRWRFAVNSGDEQSAGSIDYRGFDANALAIVGAGTAINSRQVTIYDTLNVQNITMSGSLSANDYRANNGHYWQHSVTNNVDWCMYVDGDTWRLYRAGSGDFLTVNNGGGINVPGTITSTGETYAAHSLATGGYVWINGMQWYNSGGYMYTPNSLRAADIISNGNLNSAGHVYCGGLDFYNNSGYWYTPNGIWANGQIRGYAGGDALYAPNGDCTVGGVVRFNGMYWQNYGGYAWCPWSVHSGGGILADAWITCQGRLTCNSDFVLAQNYNAANDCAANGVFRRSSLAFGGPRGARIENWGGDWDYYMFAKETGGPNGGQFDAQDGNGNVMYFWNQGWSDNRLKTNIRDSEIDALGAILATPVRAFDWNDLGHRYMPGVDNLPIGLVAQEVEETIPTAVFTASNDSAFNRLTDMKTISDTRIIPYLIRALQQLAEEVAELKKSR